MSNQPKEKKAVDPFFAIVAKVYGVPQTGISAIGSQPYLNKDGRLYLLKKLRTGKDAVRAIRVEFLRMSTSLLEPSICKKTLVFKDLEVEATGEASKDSVGSESVKQTLNMVAETRALNRAIWQAIGGEIMERVESNLETMNLSEEDRNRILEAGRVSYEEMERPKEAQEMTKKEQDLYAATAKRVDEISKDEVALRRALKNLNDWPLEAEKKALIEEKIRIHLSKLGSHAHSLDESPAKKKKKVAKKKGAVKKKKRK